MSRWRLRFPCTEMRLLPYYICGRWSCPAGFKTPFRVTQPYWTGNIFFTINAKMLLPRTAKLMWSTLLVCLFFFSVNNHYSDGIMSAMASQITGVLTVFSAVCSGEDNRKHPRSASLTFVRGIHRWPVDPPHKGPVTRKMFPFDDVIMTLRNVHDSPEMMQRTIV